MDTDALAKYLGIIASLLTIGSVLVAAVQFAAKRPPNHLGILSGSVVSLLTIAAGIVLVSFPLIPSVSTSYAVANALAIGGLILSSPSWLAALFITYRIGSRPWLIGLLLGGLLSYASAIVSNNIIAYLLAGAVVGLFGLIGPK